MKYEKTLGITFILLMLFIFLVIFRPGLLGLEDNTHVEMEQLTGEIYNYKTCETLYEIYTTVEVVETKRALYDYLSTKVYKKYDLVHKNEFDSIKTLRNKEARDIKERIEECFGY